MGMWPRPINEASGAAAPGGCGRLTNEVLTWTEIPLRFGNREWDFFPVARTRGSNFIRNFAASVVVNRTSWKSSDDEAAVYCVARGCVGPTGSSDLSECPTASLGMTPAGTI